MDRHAPLVHEQPGPAQASVGRPCSNGCSNPAESADDRRRSRAAAQRVDLHKGVTGGTRRPLGYLTRTRSLVRSQYRPPRLCRPERCIPFCDVWRLKIQHRCSNGCSNAARNRTPANGFSPSPNRNEQSAIQVRACEARAKETRDPSAHTGTEEVIRITRAAVG